MFGLPDLEWWETKHEYVIYSSIFMLCRNILNFHDFERHIVWPIIFNFTRWKRNSQYFWYKLITVNSVHFELSIFVANCFVLLIAVWPQTVAWWGFCQLNWFVLFILCLLNLEGFALKWYYSNVLYRTVVLYSVTEY